MIEIRQEILKIWKNETIQYKKEVTIMGCYTESLMKEIENLSPADDDYEKN